MSEDRDKCPGCSASPRSFKTIEMWSCNTFINKEEQLIRSSECYERRIAALEAERDDLQRRLEAAEKERDHFGSLLR